MKISRISTKQMPKFVCCRNWTTVTGFATIIFLQLLTFSECTDLTQFQLPPCCYGQTPFLQHAASSDSAVTVDPAKASRKQKSDHDPLELTQANAPAPIQGKMHRFMYPIESFEISNNTNETTTSVRRSPKSALIVGNNTSSIFDKVVEVDSKSETNDSAFRMPPNWELHLRQALYQSMNATASEKADSRSADAGTDADSGVTTLWQNIRDAPLAVIEPSTRKPSSSRIPELELANSRISGVMVNTKTGVELRASASTYPVAPVLNAFGDPCDCHLIHHGDALLAYWSVANSDGNGIEYLVYPVPHNIPTPPVFLPFHTDKILRPSPVDLNPAISNSDSREIPFQASLEFGVNVNSVSEPLEQNLIGLNSDILQNGPQRYGFGLGYPTQQIIENVPVKTTTDVHHHFHHVGEPFGGIYPGPGFPPFQLPNFPHQDIRQFRKLTIGPGPEPLPGPGYENQPPVVLPPLLDHPNSIQQIISEQGPPPPPPPNLGGPGPVPDFGIPPPPPGNQCVQPYPGCPEFGSYPGPGPSPEFRPDYDQSPPGSDVGRPRPGDPDYGRYPGDPEYRPRPGEVDNGRYPDTGRYPDGQYPDNGRYPDSNRPRPGDPDYRPLPGDPGYDRYPGDPNYRPGPGTGDPNYGAYPGDPGYRPDDPNYGRYPGEPDYNNYNRPRPENNYAERFPESRPYSSGVQARPNNKPRRQQQHESDRDRPPKLKFSMGVGVGSSSGKIRFLDSKNHNQLSASSVQKQEKKFYPAKGTESTYILKF